MFFSTARRKAWFFSYKWRYFKNKKINKLVFYVEKKKKKNVYAENANPPSILHFPNYFNLNEVMFTIYFSQPHRCRYFFLYFIFLFNLIIVYENENFFVGVYLFYKFFSNGFDYLAESDAEYSIVCHLQFHLPGFNYCMHGYLSNVKSKSMKY